MTVEVEATIVEVAEEDDASGASSGCIGSFGAIGLIRS